MNMFLLTYDYNDVLFNQPALHQYIRDNKYIDGWWHWLPGIYIIRTPLEQHIVSDLIKNIVPGVNFLVMKLDSTTRSTGMLPRDAWDWLNTNGQGKQVGLGIAATTYLPPPKR